MTHTVASIPLIAILRGTTPSEILAQADTLITAGFSMIEVPLNSPNAIESISLLVSTYGNEFLLGAGTVYNEELAQQVIDTGANFIVTPNFNQLVVIKAVSAGCVCYPGVVTPTEAFAAVAAGASGLKLFPISMLGMDGLKAMMSVLPKEISCFPVGGINATAQSMHPYLAAGAKGFGLGSSLYRAGMTLDELRKNAHEFVSVYKQFNV